MIAWRRQWLERLETSGRYPAWVLFAVLAGVFATNLPFTVLAVSLGSIADELGTSEATLTWVITAPLLLSAMAFPVLGKFGDLRGHRRVFLAGFIGATILAFATAFSWDALSLITLRSASALLGSATQPAAMAIIFSVYPQEKRARAMGWWGMVSAGAPSVGLLVGGPVIDWIGWRSLFVLQGGVSVLALTIALLVLRETKPQQVKMDYPGALTLALSACGLMSAFIAVRLFGGLSYWAFIGVAVGVMFAVWFVRIERRAAHPLLPLSLFRSRLFSATLVCTMLLSAAYLGALVMSSLVFYEFFGFSVTMASFITALRTASVSLSAPVGGRLTDRLGERAVLVTGNSLMSLAIGGMIVALLIDNPWLFALAMISQGVGDGLNQPAVATATARAVDDNSLGIATAVNRMFSLGGASFGIAFITLVYSGYAAPDSFILALAATLSLSLGALVAAAAITRRS